MNDTPELKRKGQLLIDHLLEDFKWSSGTADATIVDMLPLEPVDCYAGYDLDLKKVWEKKSLRNLVAENGSGLLHDYIYDYARNIIHTEERGDVQKDSCMKCDPSAVEKQTCVTNIDYVTGIDEVQDDEFYANVTEDLWLRGFKPENLPTVSADRVPILRKCLYDGIQVKRCRSALILNEDALAVQILNPGILAICILHAKMRMAEKLVQQLILAGLRKNPSGKEFEIFCKKVEITVNNDILGRAACNAEVGQWRVPLSKTDAKQLGDIKLSGASSVKFMAGLSRLVETCTADYSTEYTAKWISACNLFQKVIEALESKQEFCQQTIDNFQLAADEFCDEYCALTGRDGMTNYFHILRSGHFSYFLKKYKNLYLLSQQGWENVNSRFKRSFHHNTPKGGGSGGSSKLGPVMYTMARAMLWRYGHLDGLFAHLGHTNDIDVKYGDVKRIPKIVEGVTDVETKSFAETILRFGTFDDSFGFDDNGSSLNDIDEHDEGLI